MYCLKWLETLACGQFWYCCIGAPIPTGWLLVSINKSKDAKAQLTQKQMVAAMDPLEGQMNSNKEILPPTN
ncbi:MAG: hypothetical protein CM15mP9_3200 [Methanobacteriota archaeon]|nr:MAG: hypothetical protein CM15mP9_3200 [Euryarchaeota archaeon]